MKPQALEGRILAGAFVLSLIALHWLAYRVQERRSERGAVPPIPRHRLHRGRTTARGVLIACILATMACRAGRTSERPRRRYRARPTSGSPRRGSRPRSSHRASSARTRYELNGVFTPDGREFFFTRTIDGVDTIHHSVFRDGKWSDPEPRSLFPGGARGVAVDMSVSPDGRELYFLGQYRQEPASRQTGTTSGSAGGPTEGGRRRHSCRLPEYLGGGAVPRRRRERSLYFASNREDGKHLHLYRAPRERDGSFSGPAKLGRRSPTRNSAPETRSWRPTRAT